MESEQDDAPRWETAFAAARATSGDQTLAPADDEAWARAPGWEEPPAPSAYFEAYLEAFADDRRGGGQGRRSTRPRIPHG